MVTCWIRMPTFEWYMTSFAVKNIRLRKTRVKVRLDYVLEHHQSFQVQFSTQLGGPTRMFKEEENFHFGFFWLLHLNSDYETWNKNLWDLQLLFGWGISRFHPITMVFLWSWMAHTFCTLRTKYMLSHVVSPIAPATPLLWMVTPWLQNPPLRICSLFDHLPSGWGTRVGNTTQSCSRNDNEHMSLTQ